MLLYDYFRSSAAYRVRIALHLKGMAVEQRPVHLLRDGGEHHQPSYLARNPQGLVPALELDDGSVITQSLAIIDYLEAIQPEPRLLPAEPVLAARIRAVALIIACDTHPLTNFRVATFLESQLEQSPASIEGWRRHWFLKGGLEAVEALIDPAPYCFGAKPTLADACLIPQLFSARRFETQLEHLPKVLSVEAECLKHPAFVAAHPSAQPDAE